MRPVAWYWNRLTVMSAAEVRYRMGQALRARAERTGLWGRSVGAPSVEAVDEAVWLARQPEVDPERYRAAADRVVRGEVDVLANGRAVGEVPTWNRDPLTGTIAPLAFGKAINVHDPKVVGNIKYLWELNRHLQLVTLAQAYSLTREWRYLECLRTQLESWFEQCPFGKGPNWSNSLELAIRLINWAGCWTLIGGRSSEIFQDRSGASFKSRWLRAIYQHTRFIAGHLSQHSSANNHLIGEAAGLFIAGCVWPYWDQVIRRRAQGHRILSHEALAQNAPDGVNREQAIGYQQFVLDFLLLAAWAGKARGIEFANVYWARIEAMLGYLASVMDVGGNVPMFGDSDDGSVMRLSQEEGFSAYHSLLTTGAVLFKQPELNAKGARVDDKTKWLLGARAKGLEQRAVGRDGSHSPTRRAFPEGGYYILGCDLETPREIRLIVDAGPLGYTSIAAHGHADALSIVLSMGGRELLVDPGTYAYHGADAWRRYFRGTAAHNTLRVDRQDQSVSGGNFMWLRHADARCERWESSSAEDVFEGVHEGYRRYEDPVTHRRRIRLDKASNVIDIIDEISCHSAHTVERFWHFSDACEVSQGEGLTIARNADAEITLSSGDADMDIRQIWGQAEPPIGWVSRRFGEKTPTTTVIWTSRIEGTAQFSTRIACRLCPTSHSPVTGLRD